GDDAIALYRQHHEEIDLVLLDVQMPGRDGPHTLAALQELDPDVFACFMTGDFTAYTEEDLLSLGATFVFGKPIRPTELAHFLELLVSTFSSATFACATTPLQGREKRKEPKGPRKLAHPRRTLPPWTMP